MNFVVVSFLEGICIDLTTKSFYPCDWNFDTGLLSIVKNQIENSRQQREQALTVLSHTVTTAHTPLLDSNEYSMYSSAKHFF